MLWSFYEREKWIWIKVKKNKSFTRNPLNAEADIFIIQEPQSCCWDFLWIYVCDKKKKNNHQIITRKQQCLSLFSKKRMETKCGGGVSTARVQYMQIWICAVWLIRLANRTFKIAPWFCLVLSIFYYNKKALWNVALGHPVLHRLSSSTIKHNVKQYHHILHSNYDLMGI